MSLISETQGLPSGGPLSVRPSPPAAGPIPGGGPRSSDAIRRGDTAATVSRSAPVRPSAPAFPPRRGGAAIFGVPMPRSFPIWRTGVPNFTGKTLDEDEAQKVGDVTN